MQMTRRLLERKAINKVYLFSLFLTELDDTNDKKSKVKDTQRCSSRKGKIYSLTFIVYSRLNLLTIIL
jgi:hypothetical protein